MIELLLALQEDDVPSFAITTETPQAVFPSEITYSVACGSIGHEITFIFEGREWAGLTVNGSEIDLETQAFELLAVGGFVRQGWLRQQQGGG